MSLRPDSYFIQHMPLIFSRVTPPSFPHPMPLIFSRVTPPSSPHSSLPSSSPPFLADAERDGFGAVAPRPAGIAGAEASGAGAGAAAGGALTPGTLSPVAPA